MGKVLDAEVRNYDDLKGEKDSCWLSLMRRNCSLPECESIPGSYCKKLLKSVDKPCLAHYNSAVHDEGGLGLLLDVSRALRAPGEAFPFTHYEHIAPQDISGEKVTFEDPVVFEGRFSMSGDDLSLEGIFTAAAHSRCCNCLEPATVNLKVPFHEVFSRVDYISDDFGDDPERQVFTGSKVDLEHLAMTLAVLELPIRILCRPDCEGYRELSDTYRPAGDSVRNPFSVLQQLITKDQDDQEV